MKGKLIGKKNMPARLNASGSSTLEIIMAFAVLVLAFTATISIAFANQSLALYTELNQQALYKARQELEGARSLAYRNFTSLADTSPIADDIYTKELIIDDQTFCRKRVTAKLAWQTDAGRPQEIRLASEFTDWTGAMDLGQDCPTSPPEGKWTDPLTFVSRNIDPPGSPASGIDAAGGITYLTGGLTGPTAWSDFFILDARNMVFGDPSSIPIVSSISTGDGLVAVDFASTSPTKAYAFVANNEDANTNQLQIIDVSNISSPAIASQLTLPGVAGSCPFACPGGRSIYYYNHKAYMGLHYIVGSPAEFHVIDVSDPTNPIWKGSYNVNHNINKIIVRDQYVGLSIKRLAYLATSADNQELIVLDVTDPLNIVPLGTGFDAEGDEDARSIFAIGDKLYLGRDRGAASRPDFYVLDIKNPATGVTEIVSRNLGMNPGSYVAGIHVSGRFGFLALNDPNDGFEVLDITDPALPFVSTFNFSQKTTDLDFDGEYIYTSNESNDALRVIGQAQCSDGKDNDSDAKTDEADPNCHTDGNAENPASYESDDNNEAS